MNRSPGKRLRCAIYTRVSTDHGLEQDFNSLDAQREAAEAYIKSQAHEGWTLIRTAFDDGGFSGGSIERPALQRLLADIRAGKIDVIVVYKVDRLTRSLADFAKLVELFDAHQVSFVSVTQSFNTTTSMGRLTLNVLLSFAQFEREVTSERIRDKIAASKKRGLWVGGMVPLGYASRGQEAGHRRGGSRAGAADLPALSGARQPRQAAAGSAETRASSPSCAPAVERPHHGAASPSPAARWPICCATASTSARWSIAARSARPSTSPSSIASCSRRCRQAHRQRRKRGARAIPRRC